MRAFSRQRSLRHLTLWLMTVTLFGCATFQPAGIESSPNDERSYRHLVLANKLEVLLVSDPKADKAAAALDVKVGSRQDPKEYQGLAHFLEHMLFLGTEKYPNPGEYQDFISQHGGSHNAYTSYENTNYFFDVQPEHFEAALDRFSQQFVAPLFTAEYVEREKNAVHSEFTASIREDSRRYYSALKEVLNPDHPFTNFTVGNLQTLADKDQKTVRAAMLEFYDRYYSANLMRLVIHGKQGLDELEQLARAKFSAIPNRDRTLDAVEVPIIEPSKLPALLTVEPIMDRRTLSLMFPLPSIEPHHRAKPDYYISSLIGHEGEGSLLSWLKAQGWADSLSSGMALDNEQESILSISITLTAEGLKNYQKVVRDTFAYINLVKDQGIERWRFDEQSKMLSTSFRYQEKAEPIHYVSYLASRLQDYKPSEVIIAPYRMDQYDPKLYKDFVSRLTPDNVLISLMAKSVPTDRKSSWYNTDYGFRTLNEDERAELEPINSTAAIHLPAPNPFIPEDFAMLASPQAGKPERLQAQANLEAWHALDTSYGAPRANFYLSVRSAQANATPKKSVMTELYVDLVRDALNEYAYPASLAGLNYSVYKHMRGLTIRVEGYSDKQKVLLQTVLDTLTSFEPQQERFDILYDNLRRRLENAQQRKPYERTLSEVRKLMLEPYWTEEEQLAALKQVSFSEVKDFIPQLLSQIATVTLAHGNLSKAEATEMNRLVAAKLTDVAESVDVNRARVVKLTPGSNWYRQLSLTHNDTGFTWLFQGKDKEFKTRAQYALLTQLIGSAYYQEIRTQRQLGYVVFASPLNLLEYPGLGFIVQSPGASPEQIAQATTEFLTSFTEQFEKLPNAVFGQHRQALAANLLERPKTLGTQSERYWISIDEMNYDFDTRQRIAEEVLKLEKADLHAFFEQEMLKQPTSLMVSNRGESLEKEAASWIPQNFRRVDSKSSFVQQNDLFPLQ